jgi:hypothetical protein
MLLPNRRNSGNTTGATPQHHNTTTPQHRNTTTAQQHYQTNDDTPALTDKR